jgi:hypothetical protein
VEGAVVSAEQVAALLTVLLHPRSSAEQKARALAEFMVAAKAVQP